jgi:hypothetical protein
MLSIACRAAVLAQRAPRHSLAAASKSFSTKSPAALRGAKRNADGMVGLLLVAGSAAIITWPARSERNELGHPVPQQIIRAANASFRDATTPSLRGLLKVSNHACIQSYLEVNACSSKPPLVATFAACRHPFMRVS